MLYQSLEKGRKAVIIGGGPAGLTCAYELLAHTDIQPLVFEMSDGWGGISRTFNHQGNRIDLGGHRFFSKSDEVMEWWQNILPVEENPSLKNGFEISYQNKKRDFKPSTEPRSEDPDAVMLIRSRVSRILYQGKFFEYPLSLSFGTLKNLGIWETLRIGFSYIRARLLPIRPEKSLRDFVINRFGRRLYATFFRDYTEKVWGIPCDKISAEWGAQRIKGVSISSALKHAVKKPFTMVGKDVRQKNVETSLIERFLYPKFGPGQMWDKVAERVEKQGAKLFMKHRIEKLEWQGSRIVAASVMNLDTGETERIEADYFFSTMPVRTLLRSFSPEPQVRPKQVSDGLLYRDFMTVGLLASRVKLGGGATTGRDLERLLPDNWIYIQEPGVKLGRLQIFNNWSPFMVADPEKVWMGLEYFLNDTDELWSWPDSKIVEFAIAEMEKIHILDKDFVEDSIVIRTPKAYPAYFGTYDQFGEVREYLDKFENLFCIGRNGMHRYNNQDHSMLAAMTAVRNIKEGRKDKSNIWTVNTEQSYHEEKEAG